MCGWHFEEFYENVKKVRQESYKNGVNERERRHVAKSLIHPSCNVKMPIWTYTARCLEVSLADSIITAPYVALQVDSREIQEGSRCTRNVERKESTPGKL
jgi:hypothetical protein